MHHFTCHGHGTSMNEDGVDCNMLISNKDKRTHKRTQVQTFCEIIHGLEELQDVLSHAQALACHC